MRKIIFLLLLLVMPVSVHAIELQIFDSPSVSNTIIIPGKSQSEIYSEVKLWLRQNLDINSQHIYYDNEELGQFIFRGLIYEKSKLFKNDGYSLLFIMRIASKDGMALITFDRLREYKPGQDMQRDVTIYDKSQYDDAVKVLTNMSSKMEADLAAN